MKAPTRILFISILILVVFPRWGETCLPEFPQVVFTRPSGPDMPMSKFAAGRIGMPLPTWRRAFLVVAYRYLDEKPLSTAEQHSLLDFFNNNKVREQSPADDAVRRWLTERGEYQGGPKPKVTVFRNGSSPYSGFLNCPPLAFENAIMSLHARAKQFGPHSAELREWINGQDEVFHDCHEGSSTPNVLPANANALLRADRAYQIAAANFYSLRLPEALAEFDAISKDTSSPWQRVAAYMAARTMIRQAWVDVKAGTDEEYDPAILRHVGPRLNAIMSNPKFGTLRKDARRLEALVKFHLYPEQRQHELAHILLSGRSGSDFGQQLLDYKLLLDGFLDVSPTFDDGLEWGPAYDRRVKRWKQSQYLKLQKKRSDELSDWLMTIQSDAPEAKTHAVTKWRSTRSVPWLFATLAKLDGKDDAVTEILLAAAQLRSAAPGFSAISFHRSRLLRESGRPEEARRVIDTVLHSPDSLPLSARNLLEDENMRNSPDLPNFQNGLARNPVELTGDPYQEWEDYYCYHKPDCKIVYYGTAKPKVTAPLLPQFDLSSAEVLNKRLPVDVLAEIASSESLPENLRRNLAVATWVRAGLLGNFAAAQKVGKTAALSRPQLKAYVDEYNAATSDEERRFTALFAIVHFPGLRPFVDAGHPRSTDFDKIDDYRDNWWCTDVGGIPDDLNFEKQYGDNAAQVVQFEKRVEASSPVFLSEEQKARAAEEWKNIFSMGLAADYLPKEVLTWAKAHPDDPRVPEALHFAWRVDRYGCADNRQNVTENSWSHDIFKLLHKRYPTSEWTKKTRVW